MSSSPTVRGRMHPGFDEILTPDALAFLARLDGEFAGRRADLLAQRRAQSRRINRGADLDFSLEEIAAREDDSWSVAPIAPGLADRRVELVAPVTRSHVEHAMASNASTWLADLEDATAPTWFNLVDGQIVLRDAVRAYAARPQITRPTLIMRPRAWHLCEKHITIDGRPISATLVDFGLYFFHNAKALIEAGYGPYFYLPKIESGAEARLWNDIFNAAQDALDIPRGTVRATVLIETLPAAFAMEEILFELREHASGLNAGRWDYIFSYVRTFAHRGDEYVLPDRERITMTTPFMRTFTDLLVATAHKRGTHAIAAPAANNPTVQDEERRHRALNVVHAEKEREAEEGFDGSWVAHPAMVDTVMSAFTHVLGDKLDQIEVKRTPRHDAHALVSLEGTMQTTSLHGVRSNVSVALQYLAAWIDGQGAVAIGNYMEDAATTEICRAQLWQWMHHSTQLAEGPQVSRALLERLIDEEMLKLKRGADADMQLRLDEAREVLERSALTDELPGFFTNYAYVRFLLDEGLRMPRGIDAEDLRQSEKVAGDAA